MLYQTIKKRNYETELHQKLGNLDPQKLMIMNTCHIEVWELCDEFYFNEKYRLSNNLKNWLKLNSKRGVNFLRGSF